MSTSNDKHIDICSTIHKQWAYSAHGRDALICILICVCTKCHIHLFLLGTHEPNLAYCALFLNKLET